MGMWPSVYNDTKSRSLFIGLRAYFKAGPLRTKSPSAELCRFCTIRLILWKGRSLRRGTPNRKSVAENNQAMAENNLGYHCLIL